MLNSKSISINFDTVFRSWKLAVKWSRGDCHSNWSQVAKLLNTKLLNDIFTLKHLFVILITVLFRFNTSDSLLPVGGSPSLEYEKFHPLFKMKKIGEVLFLKKSVSTTK